MDQEVAETRNSPPVDTRRQGANITRDALDGLANDLEVTDHRVQRLLIVNETLRWRVPRYAC